MRSAGWMRHRLAFPWSIPWATGLGLLLACVAIPAIADDDDFVESVPAKAGETIDVEIDFGDGLRPDPGYIWLTSHDGNEVRARVDTTGWGSWDVEVTLERRSGRAHLDVRARGTTTWLFGGPNIRIDVAVPEGANVNVVSWGGNVRVENLVGGLRGTLHDADIVVHGVEGPVKLNLEDSGSAKIEEIRGELIASADSGEIRASGVTGRAEVRAGSGLVALRQMGGPITVKSLDGDIDLAEVAGPVTARSDRGAIDVAFSRDSGGLVETEQGDVAISVPEASDWTLDLKTSDGNVEVSAPGFRDGKDPSHVRGALGSGGSRLVVRSGRGEIRVSQR